jgi:hypothetical protein
VWPAAHARPRVQAQPGQTRPPGVAHALLLNRRLVLLPPQTRAVLGDPRSERVVTFTPGTGAVTLRPHQPVYSIYVPESALTPSSEYMDIFVVRCFKLTDARARERPACCPCTVRFYMASWPWRYSRYAGGWGAVGEGGRSGHGGRGGASRQPAASRPRLGLSRPRAQRRAGAQTAQRDLILTPGSSADGVAVFSRPPCLSLLYLLVCWLINVCTRAFIIKFIEESHDMCMRHMHTLHV